MDSVDVFISVADNSSAFKILKKSLKQANTPLQFLGIYKRYFKLGSMELAQKTLTNGLKKFPDNEELITVYTWFLYNQNEIDKALEQAQKLSGTKYVSILSEINVKKASQNNSVDFTAVEYAPIYSDAYISSKNQLWLQNAAICLASAGLYNEAFSKKPADNVENPLFWAQVAYDARKYNSTISLLSELEEDSFDKNTLLADAHEILGSHDIAQESRLKIFASNNENILPEIYFNCVRYANSVGDVKLEYSFLNELINKYPAYVPGLHLYKDYALRSLDYPNENQLAKALRETEFRSLDMQNYDDLPKISVHQVRDLLESNMYSDKNPEIAGLLFSYEINPVISENLLPQEKKAYLWLMLEHFDSEHGYPPELINLAIPFLLKNGETLSARSIFDKNLVLRFGTDSYVDILDKMSGEEIEFAAYFAASGIGKPKDYNLAFHLYEYLANDKTERFFNLAESIYYKPTVSAYINLAELYAGSRQLQKAKEAYSNAAGSTETLKDKAEVMFRLANLQYEYGDIQDALVSLEYCLSIMPSHPKGRILKNKIGKK
ncbi:MAG: hypothetical protein IKZ04_02010 [Spirochaetaceae bacterium]|nr:hypothetical protein [Spirochaetaceae bacterium]